MVVIDKSQWTWFLITLCRAIVFVISVGFVLGDLDQSNFEIS